jgi:ATP/maltotriose-dependent transcriptional regulator MalT
VLVDRAAPLEAPDRDRPDGEVFVGRGREFDLVVSCLDMVRSGRPWVVWVEGDAGSGKTSFARRVLRGLPSDVRVTRAFGDKLASDVMFAVADQLAPLTARSAFAAGLELLQHLSGLQDSGSVVVLLEDFHWSDLASRQALLSMTQRLDNDRVLVLVTSRPELDVDGWERLRHDQSRCALVRMGSFSAEEVAELARHAQVELTPRDAARLQRHTGGHPLYVWTLLRELTPAQLADPRANLPVPRSLASTILVTLAQASPDARRLAAALAVVNRRIPLAFAGLVAGVSDPAAALEQLLTTGLVTWQPQERETPVELAHPLYRSAIYDDLLPTGRRELHRAAADVLDTSAAFAHRVAAADTSDDSLADELEELVNHSEEPLSMVTKARYLQWASALSSRRDQRERRLLNSARCLLADRRTASAAKLRPEIEACAPCALRSLLLGMLAWAEGDLGAAERLFQAASSPTAAVADPVSAAHALLRLANIYNTRFSIEKAMDAANRALLLLDPDDDLARDAWAALAIATGVEHGAARGLEALYERFPAPPQQVGLDEANLLVTRAMLGFYAGRVNGPVEDLRCAISLARRGATLPQLPRAHIHLSQLLFAMGDWDEALVHGRTALSLLADEPHVWEEAQVHSAVVAVSAARGEWEAATAHVALAQQAASVAGTPEAQVMARAAAASLARAQDHPDQVVAALRPLTGERQVFSAIIALGWWPLLVSSLVSAGQLEEAEREFALLETAARTLELDVGLWMDILRAELAEASGRVEETTKWLERALGRPHADVPVLERAVLHHSVGKHRLAVGDRRGAVPELRAAWKILEPLGAKPYLQRVDADLQLCGIGLQRGDHQVLDLTEREQSVAVLVGRGMTNREAASQLYVSEKAVEYHLGNIFGKLGINSRRELRGLLAVTASVAHAH